MDIKTLSDEQLKMYITGKIDAYRQQRKEMELGVRYYNGEQEILRKCRTAIGEDGKVKVLTNLPNARLLDNQYKKAVDQKVNYLFSDLPNIQGDNAALVEKLSDVMDMRFLRTINKIAKDTYNTSIAWLYVYTDGEELKYKKLDPLEVIPLWTDNNHESLDGVIQLYSYTDFEDGREVEKKQVRFFTDERIRIYEQAGGELTLIEETSYLQKGNAYYNFGRIPFIYFKTPTERSLVYEVKCLQDALNSILSNFQDNMLEDPRNTILILKNYDGEDLGMFRQQLATYSAVKVEDVDGARGGVETLKIDVNHENYLAIVTVLKKCIKENCRIVDLDNDRGSNPNTLNIQAMYSDMELDANQLELEFSASLEYFTEIVKQIYHLQGTATIAFKRNMMVNQESVVNMIRNSVGLVSEETLRAKHPLVDDAQEEEARIAKEKEAELIVYGEGDGHGEDEQEE
ncbi:MAG: phage portal protein [Peptoniphilus sp.]|nr:phage portal protein [Peptoniphilus sp.]MDY3118193.1 phage portal protein [Peptoniphilus sp.]